MKITAIETLRTEEFANVLWVRVHTDAGIIGLGETFYGAGAVESHLHDTLAMRLLGKDPLHIEALHREMTNLPMAQASTGVESRATSAVDIALWDLLGKAKGEPVYNLLGGKTKERVPCYATTARPDLAKEMGFFGAKVPLPWGPHAGDVGMRKNVEFIAGWCVQR